MKSLKNYWKFSLPAFLFIIVALSSCLKKDDLGNGQQTNAAGLMAFNLAPSKNAIGFNLSGNAITYSPIAYTNYTGTYLSVFPGSGNLNAFDFNSNQDIASAAASFIPGKYYSVFLVGDSSKYENILVQDNVDSLKAVSGTAYVRYINAVADSSNTPVVKISAAGTDVFNSAAPYKTVSDFKPVAAGDVTINANNESSINTNRTISLEANKAYTILLIGKPGSTDTNTQVQIKYLTNVLITP